MNKSLQQSCEEYRPHFRRPVATNKICGFKKGRSSSKAGLAGAEVICVNFLIKSPVFVEIKDIYLIRGVNHFRSL